MAVNDDTATSGFDLFGGRDQTKIFNFDRLKKNGDEDTRDPSIYTGRSGRLQDGEGNVGELFQGSFPNEGGELNALIAAVLDEKFGLGDPNGLTFVEQDDDGLVFTVTNSLGAVKTFVLVGNDVGRVIDDYEANLGSTFSSGFDLFDPRDQIKTFLFDDPAKNELSSTGGEGRLPQGPNDVGALFTGSALNEAGGELDQLIFAALDEKEGRKEWNGLEYISNDPDELVLRVTNTAAAEKTFVLEGQDVATIISDDYDDDVAVL